MLRWSLIVIASIAGLAALVWTVGALLPERHVAATRARYGQPPDSLFAAITDVAAHPPWRAGVDAVEVLSEDPLRWREVGSYGPIVYRAEMIAPPSLFVARIDDPSQPFGGRWSWRIEPDESGGSVVTITEEGEIYSPVFRFFARFVFGYHGTQEAYHRALGARFGEETAVERVDVADPGPTAPAMERRGGPGVGAAADVGSGRGRAAGVLPVAYAGDGTARAAAGAHLAPVDGAA